MADITKVPDDQLLSMDKPDISQIDDESLLKLDKAISSTSNDPKAALTAYGANLEKTIPFMHQAGSALDALLGIGNGDSISDRYNDLESSQDAMRQAGLQTQPRIEMPSYLPDITPTGVGTIASGLATLPIGSPTKAAEKAVVEEPQLIGISAMLAGKPYY